jgi:putative transposase
MEVARAPYRAPQANAVAERFVRTARSECFDGLLILNQQHLEWAFAVFVDHYNRHRPHRALSLAPPEGRRPATSVSADGRVLRRDRLGGVVHEYVLARNEVFAPYKQQTEH